MNKLLEQKLDKIMLIIEETKKNDVSPTLLKSFIKIELIDLFYESRKEILNELLEKEQSRSIEPIIWINRGMICLINAQ